MSASYKRTYTAAEVDNLIAETISDTNPAPKAKKCASAAARK